MRDDSNWRDCYDRTRLFLMGDHSLFIVNHFVVGHVHRYNTDQFGWSAQSSEFIQKDQLLKWGSTLFHYGVILFSSDMWQEC